MKWNRRDFLKASVAVGAATAVGMDCLVPWEAQAQPAVDKWGKAPCRFCGVGCGVLVGVRKGKVVALQGDPECPVNKGLLCIKGYSLPMIMYGPDRYTAPSLRQGNKFVEISWERALDLMASKFKEAIRKHGPESVGVYFSGQSTVFEGYAVNKLMKGGVGSNNVEGNRASAWPPPWPASTRALAWTNPWVAMTTSICPIRISFGGRTLPKGIPSCTHG